MGLFKKKIIKEIDGAIWGHLFNVHKVDGKTMAFKLRFVEREGFLDEGKPVTFLRVFKPEEAQMKNIKISGWDTFDQYPDLIHFEGYLTKGNEAYLERKKGVEP